MQLSLAVGLVCAGTWAVPAHAQSQIIVGSGLDHPYGVAVDTAGDVFISGGGSNPIVEVHVGGRQTAIHVSGPRSPWYGGVAVNAAGDLFIADPFRNRVVEVPAAGPWTSTAADPGGPEGVTIDDSRGVLGNQIAIGSDLSAPEGVAVDTAGDVFIADTGNGRVVEIRSGAWRETYVGADSGANYPEGVALDAAGNVFFTDAEGQLLKMPADGGIQTSVPITGGGETSGVAVDTAGDVFIADTGHNRVVEVHGAFIPPDGFGTCPSAALLAAGLLGLFAAGYNTRHRTG